MSESRGVNVPVPPRSQVIREADGLINGDRNNQYGPPTQDFERTAAILNAMGYRRPGGEPLMAHDVAILVMAVKLSRIAWQPDKRDSWTDTIGYAACGWECVVNEVADGQLGNEIVVDKALAALQRHADRRD